MSINSASPASPKIIKDRRDALRNVAINIINEFILNPTGLTEYITYENFYTKVNTLDFTEHEKFLIKTLFFEMSNVFKEAGWNIEYHSSDNAEYLVVYYDYLVKTKN